MKRRLGVTIIDITGPLNYLDMTRQTNPQKGSFPVLGTTTFKYIWIIKINAYQGI